MTQFKIPSVKIRMFLFSVLEGIRINIIGQLPLSEIFAIFNSFSLKNRLNIFREIPDIKKISIAYLFFLISQIISDFINHSDINNAIRGWANIIMAIIVIIFLTKTLWNNNLLIITFLTGQIISLIIFAPPSENLSLSDMGFFKFRLAPILNNIILIFSWYILKKQIRNSLIVVILFFFYGLFCIALDYRSNGMFMILTGIIILFKNKLDKISIKKQAIYIIIFAILFLGLYSLYVSQVLAGKLGGSHSEIQLTRIENPYNPLSLLQSGRAETYVALLAIAEKPIFGHGSWAPDPSGKYNLMVAKIHGNENRFKTQYQHNNYRNLIPSHSVLLGAWMTSGVIGFFAIAYIFLIFVKRNFRLIKNTEVINSPFLPIIIFFFINGCWVFVFSPLSHIRQSIPILLAFTITFYQLSKNKSEKA